MIRRKVYICLSVILSIILILGITITSKNSTYAKSEDFRISGTTLTAYLGTDTFVSVPTNVTKIGEGAFKGNDNIVRIELPEKLKSIEFNAFADCTSLESIIIPDLVTKVGPGVFKGCSSLTMVEIGKSVKSWGSGVFNDCTSLSKIIVDEQNQYITYYNGAIYNGDMSLLYQVLSAREGENFVCPAEVKEIDAYAFWNLKNVKNVMISDLVSTIPRSSFVNMGSVENLVLTGNTKVIDEKAIKNNENLKQIYIPSSVKDIKTDAISGNPNVKLMTSKGSTAEKYGISNKIPVIYEAELPIDFNDSNPSNQVKPSTSIKVETDKSEKEEKNDDKNDDKNEVVENTVDSEQIQSSVEEEYVEVPYTSSGLVLGETKIVNGKAVVLMDNTKQKVYGVPKDVNAKVVEENLSDDPNEKTTQEQKTTKKQSVEKKTEQMYTVEKKSSDDKSTTKDSSKDEDSSKVSTSNVLGEKKSYKNSEIIPEREYYKDTTLVEYEINKNIKAIGRLAFARTSLKEIVIPEGVTDIDYGAFYTCEKLEKVTIPSTVVNIGNKAFEGTAWLNNWMADKDSDDFLVVGDGILIAYKGNSAHVVIPESVKEIGPEAFKGHEEIEDVDITENVSKIGASAFAGCSSLTGVKGCKGLKIVMSGAFRGTMISEDDFRK